MEKVLLMSPFFAFLVVLFYLWRLMLPVKHSTLCRFDTDSARRPQERLRHVEDVARTWVQVRSANLLEALPMPQSVAGLRPF